jgi:hypothetical protein
MKVQFKWQRACLASTSHAIETLVAPIKKKAANVKI